MSLPSFLKDSMANTVKNQLAFEPSSSVGVLVKTSDVLHHELADNPWFMAVNNMSPLIANTQYQRALSLDAQKVGYSIVTGPIGASRQPKTFINPKMTDQIYGSKSGKIFANEETGDTVFAEMQNTNSEAPTIYATHTRQIGEFVPPQVVSQAKQAENTPIKRDDSDFKKDADEIMGKSLKTDIDPSTGKKTETKHTNRSVMGTDISTGVHLLDSSTVGMLASCTGFGGQIRL